MNFDQFLRCYEKEKVVEYPNDSILKPIISVVVITYQHQKFIRKCIDSILAQDLHIPFEVIIGEDDSSDGTREICREYAQNNPDIIRLIEHKRANNIIVDGKPTFLFNSFYCLYKTRGKYIAICEGDDYWFTTDKLQKQIDALESYPDCTICSAGYVLNNVVSGLKKEVVTRRSGKDGFSYEMEDGWLHKVSVSLFRKDSFLMSDLLQYQYFRDVNLFYHVLESGKGYYLPEVLAVCHHHEGGIHSMIPILNKYLSTYKCYKELNRINDSAYLNRMHLDATLALLNHMLFGNQQVDNPYKKEIRHLVQEAWGLCTSARDILKFATAFFPKQTKAFVYKIIGRH